PPFVTSGSKVPQYLITGPQWKQRYMASHQEQRWQTGKRIHLQTYPTSPANLPGIRAGAPGDQPQGVQYDSQPDRSEEIEVYSKYAFSDPRSSRYWLRL